MNPVANLSNKPTNPAVNSQTQATKPTNSGEEPTNLGSETYKPKSP